LLDPRFEFAKQVRDAPSCLAIAIKIAPRPMVAFHVSANCVEDVVAMVVDIDDVFAALPPGLARANVHRGNAEIRAFPDRNARISNYPFAVIEQTEKVARFHVLEKVEIRRLFLFAKGADSLRSAIRPCINIRPKPEYRQTGIPYREKCFDHVL